MQEAKFIVREPLLNSQERVLGYELTLQHSDNAGGKLSKVDAAELVRFVTKEIGRTESGSLLDGHAMFVRAFPELLKTDAFSQMPPRETVLAVTAADLEDKDTVAAVRGLRGQGYGISLREANLDTMERSVLSLVTHLELSIAANDFAAQVERYRSLDMPSLRVVARNITNWQQFDFCALLNMDSFVGRLHLMPRQGKRSRELNPAQAMILQLMEMVRRSADVKQLESVLKRDPALSYKLLRYINSAGFGLGCEVQSLRHAVTLLGYSPLYRWLGLLLATATTTGYSPVLMQTAVIRGRFAELLGNSFLPRNEAENLFVAGMFSLLDRLLGIPMEDVLEKIQLSDSVTEALLKREGIYGPFLALAEACELNTGEMEAMATALCISPKQVNAAHLSALAWVQGLKL